MGFLDGIEDLLSVREFERHYKWLLSLAVDAGKSAKDQSAVIASTGMSVGETAHQRPSGVMTQNTGETGSPW